MDRLKTELLLLLAFVFGLGLIAFTVDWLLRRFPSPTKVILALLVFAYLATMLVLFVNGNLRGSYRGHDYEDEAPCPGRPGSTC